jgi:hypothetical protein
VRCIPFVSLSPFVLFLTQLLLCFTSIDVFNVVVLCLPVSTYSLLNVKKANPEVSYSDLYALAGCVAVEFLGGPKVTFCFGRKVLL